MSDKMEMSLDDIIMMQSKKNKFINTKNGRVQGGSIRKPKSGGGLRGIQRFRNGTAFIQKSKFKQEHALKPPSKPTFVMVCNLDYGVDDDDIMELFNQDGLVEKALVHYDRNGNSLGTAQLSFKFREDAFQIIRQFHGVRLDGRRLKLHLVRNTRNFRRPEIEDLSSQIGSFQTRSMRNGSQRSRSYRKGSFQPRPFKKNKSRAFQPFERI
ncbi:THO complex subunit 4-B [Drosophila mauritiana]|uniref:THO complex subunit 4-B n=1 Tax=Drosophila mauritiana TaxID=7226 RepID=A0A6P8KNK7_DROMA|nr:THO complex subunit 4-B [Drosophila mauritiana]